MNLKHLFYFWKTAGNGGVVRAARALNLTPQTISGQIRLLEESLGTQLFGRAGRGMELTSAGRLVMEYADQIFSLGAELEQSLRHYPAGRPTEFHVGVSDAVPKPLAYRLLKPAIDPRDPVRIVCREWRLDRLLGELAVHKLDLVISDSPIPPTISVRGYNHPLGTSGLSLIAPASLAGDPVPVFPACLASLPLLMPGEDSSIRRKLDDWMERRNIRPRIVGEFDDLALIAEFGRAGVGIFVVPTTIETETLATGDLRLLGRIDDVRIEYFAISVERRVTHASVKAITEAARNEQALVEGGGKPRGRARKRAPS